VNLVCGCTNVSQCNGGNAYPEACSANGRCVCNGIECMSGEVCIRSGPDSVCGCNGAAACFPGTVCCQTPAGCYDLQTDSQNCGACGWVCPAGTACQNGTCQ
jgi:hypothetical protein